MPARGFSSTRLSMPASSRWICSATRVDRWNSLGIVLYLGSDRARHFHALVALDLVARLHVVVVLHADAALGASTHFAHVVLEAAQRLQGALEDHHVVAQHADRVVALDVTFHHQAAGDGADLGGTEHVAHLGQAHDLLAGLSAEHAAHGLLHVVDGFVDHAVVAQVHAGLRHQAARAGVGTHVEADDHRLGGGSQVHVGLGDAAHAAG